MYDGKGEENGRTVAQLETGMEIPPRSVLVDVMEARIADLEAEIAGCSSSRMTTPCTTKAVLFALGKEVPGE